MYNLLRIPSNCVKLCQRSASKDIVKMPKFSESKAYCGIDKFGMHNKYMDSQYRPSYYDTRKYKNKRLLSFLLSIGAIFTYFGWLREENDLDIIFDTPGYILSSNLERKVIRTQIEQARAKGEDTKLLEAELAYVDVKEAALKAKFDK